MMKRLHIVGGRNHGKTSLIVELLEIFKRRGIRVGSIKHTPHPHALDTPGKDSYRHRMAGADPCALVTPDGIGVFLGSSPQEDLYERLDNLYLQCRFVLVEGHLSGDGAKIEVWRQELGTSPLSRRHTEIQAIVSDDSPTGFATVWRRSDTEDLANRILDLMI